MQQLGVKNIVLSSVFVADRDEDVIDFMNVNSSLGNITFIQDLITKLKNKGIFYVYILN